MMKYRIFHRKSHAHRGQTILEKAASMCEGVNYLSLGAAIAGSHHERFDGKGYPNGLAGENIPLSGRIVALVDVFDALSSQRPYKKAWPLEEVLAEIYRSSGSQFDPVVVEAFFGIYYPNFVNNVG